MSRLFQVNKAGGPVTTSGTATANIVTFDLVSDLPIPAALNNVALHVEGIMVMKDASNNSASFRVARAFKMISGTLSALGTQATVIGVGIGDAALSTAAGTLTSSGNIILLQGTGIIALTIEWTGFLSIWSGQFLP